MSKGFIQIYTGNGKGKTTAALGLSLRAVCAGKKVYFAQFAKGSKYSELKSQFFLPDFTINQFGQKHFIKRKPSELDKKKALNAFLEVAEIINSKKYDIVVLDEINIALYYKLINLEDVINLLKNKPAETEIILTGRHAHKKIIELADLVTEMKEIKHYYKKGIKARVGIEK